MTGHVHQKLMAQYAEDAKTTDKPWELWELLHANCVDWLPMKEGRCFYATSTYRRKPKMKLIHGVEVPDIGINPNVGVEFYASNVGLPCYFEIGTRRYSDCSFTDRMVKRGICYPSTEEGKQAAILHAKAMLGNLPNQLEED